MAQRLAYALATLQLAYDGWLSAPRAWAYALAGLAILLLALGRQGQRVLCGVLLGGAGVAFSLRGLQPRFALGSPVPGLTAIAAGGALLLFGLFVPVWATALLCVMVGAAAGALAATALGLSPVIGAAPLAGLGLLAGHANVRPLSVALPPLAAAVAATLALTRLLRPKEVVWALALLALSGSAFLAAAIWRDAVARRRWMAQNRARSEKELRDRIELQKKAFAAQADEAAADESETRH